jgi:hypothetical protein
VATLLEELGEGAAAALAAALARDESTEVEAGPVIEPTQHSERYA